MAEFQDKAGQGYQDDWSWPTRKGGSARKPGRKGAGGSANAFGPMDKASLARVVSKAPEVVVKVGRPKKVGTDGKRLYASQKGEGVRSGKFLEYIGRNGKIEIETSDGTTIVDHAGRRSLHAEWKAHHDDAIEQGLATGRTRLYHALVLSMPPGTDIDGLKDAARAFAHREFGGRHDYVLALHTDTDHPHVHIGVRTVGYDGRHLHPTKTDLHQWRVTFAEQLRDRGIEAEATARPARGVILKPDRQAVRHIRRRHGTSQVDQAQRAEVARELVENGSLSGRPWESAITARKTEVIASYHHAAERLRVGGDRADRALADRIDAFVEAMPAHETRRHQIAAELIPQLEQSMARDGPGARPVR
jgi:type IV secretion system T-DNA border endonuclease VirD2